MFVNQDKIEKLYNMQCVNFKLKGAVKYVLFVKLNMQGCFIYIQLFWSNFKVN